VETTSFIGKKKEYCGNAIDNGNYYTRKQEHIRGLAVTYWKQNRF